MRRDFVTTFRSQARKNRRKPLTYRGRARISPENLLNMG